MGAGKPAGKPADVQDLRDVTIFTPETSATVVDDIPPVQVLEAAQNQERKEAKELLDGFLRPGRVPKDPSATRDFVEYYARKKGDESRPVATAKASQAEPSRPLVGDPTVVRSAARRDPPRRRSSSFVPVLLLAMGVLAVVAVATYLAVRDDAPAKKSDVVVVPQSEPVVVPAATAAPSPAPSPSLAPSPSVTPSPFPSLPRTPAHRPTSPAHSPAPPPRDEAIRNP